MTGTGQASRQVPTVVSIPIGVGRCSQLALSKAGPANPSPAALVDRHPRRFTATEKDGVLVKLVSTEEAAIQRTRGKVLFETHRIVGF